MWLDLFLLLVIAGIIALSAAEGLARSAVMLVTFYLLCILLGLTVVAFNAGELLSSAISLAPNQPAQSEAIAQSVIFVAILIPTFAFAAVLSHTTLEDAQVGFLGWGDNVLATVLGALLALAIAAVLCNVWGVLVSTPWSPAPAWVRMRTVYDQSILRPVLLRLLLVFRRTLFPLAASGYPVFFVPQI
jgi:hypothetical protein